MRRAIVVVVKKNNPTRLGKENMNRRTTFPSNIETSPFLENRDVDVPGKGRELKDMLLKHAENLYEY